MQLCLHMNRLFIINKVSDLAVLKVKFDSWLTAVDSW